MASELASLLYAYQQRLVTCPARFTWNNWSRQTGKSFAFSLRRILRGMERGRNQIFLSASQAQSRELMMKAEQHLRAMKIAASNILESEVFDEVRFKQLEIVVPPVGQGGRPIRIIGLPANPRTARGFTGDLLLDEFAMHQRDVDIYAAAFPTVSRDQGEMDVCSTPMGRQNMFYRLGLNDMFHRETVTIHDAVAGGCPQDPEALRAGINDEDRWRQEYLCEFVDEATAFLTFEVIGECESATLVREADLQALRDFDGDVVAGYDVGRKRDLSVIWLFHVDGKILRCLGMVMLDKMPFREQFDIASNIARMRCLRRMCVDATGMGMQLAEELTERFGEHKVEPCTLTAAFKEQAASLMRNRFLDKTIQIHADDKTRNDLHSVRKIVTAAGNVRLEAPREDGSHADRFWACALACYAASGGAGRMEIEMGPQRPLAGLWDM
jgi:phage FluMu gp28-like protein